MAPELTPPAFGRPSAAATRPASLRAAGIAADAAVRCDGGDTRNVALRVATVAGLRHRLAGEGSQDAYAWRLVRRPRDAEAAGDGTDGTDDAGADVLVVAVADGVGGVPGSAAAAGAAAVAACDAVAVALDGAGRTARDSGGSGGSPGSGRSGAPGASGGEGGAANGVAGVLVGGDDGVGPAAVVAGVAFAAADAAVRAAGGATTLVVAAIGAEGAGWAARIGDSTAAVLADGAWYDLWPDPPGDDRPVSTATAALPGSSAPDVVEMSLPEGAAIVLMTDGVADPLRDGPTTVAPALAEGLAQPPSPLALALLADFSRQGCFDDRTMAAVWWRPSWSAGDP